MWQRWKTILRSQEMYAYDNGHPGILMMVMKQSGTNTIEVIDMVSKSV